MVDNMIDSDGNGMGGELTEANLKKIFDEMGTHTNPDTFLVSSKNLEKLKAMGAVRYDRVKCSWELLDEALHPTKPQEEQV